MDESTFVTVAERELEKIEYALEACGAELDVEVQPGGVLEVSFDDDSKLVINRHVAAQEIWLAARSGGFHFRLQNGQWVDTRGGEELYIVLSRVTSDQGGRAVTVTPTAA
ncbi:MAG TPA: iron donor protein CyaY [Denitromonas sp.]|uniref:iron donor protein CyaY n=1 Tax=Denitromonas sp. TaxID=2734609 RepID=UPI001DB26AA5|nr:iron donor protein CyaY [Rhodocyclaceae bacterium]HQU87348.1 iron donor protein CyaY [Denitromonas sp.]HQV15617.1 iron donor protein CyaY [Denitromonas sp.]